MPRKKAPGSEHTEVVGFVHVGAGGASLDNGSWLMSVHLSPWRRVGGAIQKGELRVEREGTEKALQTAMDRFEEGARVHLRVEMTGRRVLGAPLARLVNDLGAGAADPELDAALAELRKPVVIRTARLGRMVLDRRLDGFKGRALFARRRCEVWVFRTRKKDDLEADSALLEKTAARLEGIGAAWPRILDQVVDAMYPLYTGPWSDGSPVSLERFRKRLKPANVSVNPGRITVYLDAAGMFTDHAVEVRLSPEGRVREVGLA